MAMRQNNTECMITCWGVAAVIGVVSMGMLYGMAGFDALQAVFTGGALATVLALLLSLTVCGSQTAAADLAADEKPAMRYRKEAAERKAARVAATLGTAADAVAPAGAATTAAAPASTAASAPVSVQPSKALAGQQELAERKPEWKYEGEASVTPAASPAAAKADAPAKTAADAAPLSTGAPEDKPASMLATARDGGADDLKLIGGVGPKLEQTLNDLGVYHFDQIAKWGPSEIAWVDANLRFKGRIERDDWMSQAKILAAGGETEFSAKKK